jgi:hypothetical protein
MKFKKEGSIWNCLNKSKTTDSSTTDMFKECLVPSEEFQQPVHNATASCETP